MAINYSALMLGQDIYYTNKDTEFKIHIPKIKELVDMGEGLLSLYSRPFLATVRELFSGMPDVVNELSDEFPSLFDMLKDETASMQVGEMLAGESMHLGVLIINGLAYWTDTNVEDFQLLSNYTIVNKKLNWVINSAEYENFAQYIKTIMLYKPNEDLIAPKNMKSERRKQIWLSLYKGRLRKLQRQKSHDLADKILILQISSGNYIDTKTIANMTYFQFVNLLNGYAEKESSQQQLIIYASEKFDTKNMVLKNWREKVGVIKNNDEQ